MPAYFDEQQNFRPKTLDVVSFQFQTHKPSGSPIQFIGGGLKRKLKLDPSVEMWYDRVQVSSQGQGDVFSERFQDGYL
jgi:hypothetical protein